MAEERWLPVAGFEGYYEVSDQGRVRSVDRVVTFKDGVTKRATRGKLLTLSAWNGAGNYLSVPLCKGGKTKKYGVHRLVATAFIPNPDNLPEVNHKDENKNNNRVENLEWCDRQYNNTYGTAKMRAAITQGKPVLQLDENGEIINAWPTAGMAAAFTKATQGGIDGCCRGENKTSGGYGWRWAPWAKR